MFSKATIMGRVTADLELRHSSNNVPFIGFSAVVNKGRQEDQKTTFYQCVIFNELAERMIKAKVKKGSLLMITGELEMTEYQSKQGNTVTSPKITIESWEYVPLSAKTTDETRQTPKQNQYNSYSNTGYNDYSEVDCDDEIPL